MNKHSSRDFWVPATLIFVGLPLLLWATGDFPRRTLLKESLSVLTLLAFSLMLGQFFLAPINESAVKALKAARVVHYHKIIGFTFVAVLLVHPFLIVLPRYYESGIDPVEAFVTLITTFDSTGVLLGMAAWCTMVILGITSLIRGSLPMGIKTWKIFHGALSVLFVCLATWHAIDLGRHTNATVSSLLIILAAGGVALLLRSYLPKPHKKEQPHE